MTKKLKINAAAGLHRLAENSAKASEDRFSRASDIMTSAPTATSKGVPPPSVAVSAGVEPVSLSSSFDVSRLEVGKTYAVPLHLIDPNPVGVRHFYRPDRVDRVSQSLQEGGQDVAANGFVKGGRIELIEGGTRLRAARAGGLTTLDVRIEAAPASRKDQFLRSVSLHELRTNHTALDLSVAMQQLLKDGVFASQDELVGQIKSVDGTPLSKSQVSMYLRVAKIPERLLRKMSENERTCGIAIAYAISGIYAKLPEDSDRADLIASDVIEAVQEKDLSVAKTEALIAARIEGPRPRAQAEHSTFKFGGKEGQVKIFADRGQLDLSIAGLEPPQLEALQAAITRVLNTAA